MTRERLTTQETQERTTGGGGGGRKGAVALGAPVWRELALAFREVLSDPGRTLRFAGMPTLVMVVLCVAIALSHPPPQETGSAAAPALAHWLAVVLPFYSLPLVFTLWSMMRMQVWWARWVSSGDDAVGFLTPHLGGRELAFLVLSLGALAVAGSTLMLLVPVGAGVGVALDALGVPLTNRLANRLSFGLAGMALLLVGTVYGRLMVGVVPLALGRAPSLRAGWRATRGRSGRVMVLMAVTCLPMLASALFSRLTDPLEVAASVLVAGVLRTVALGANSVMLARLYTLTLGRQPLQALPSAPPPSID